MKDHTENNFYSQDDIKETDTNSNQEKNWDGPLAEQAREEEKKQQDIDNRLADIADQNQGSDNPPLRTELDPPTAPEIIPDRSPDEINYPGKQGFPTIDPPEATSSIGNEDGREEKGDEAQEAQMKEEEDRQDKIKEKEAELREAREGREESIRKSEEGNITDNRGYNEIRENSPVSSDRDKEFLN
ncbi:hypothetical protein [Emticicia sp. 17c]|uniref:hypothetical protein n=1 Tax=Emticicia sp. 17c TaxID=3127704 RepID=UPI00301BA1B2